MLTENSYNEFMDNFVEVFEEGDDFMDFDDNKFFDEDELLNGNFSLEDDNDDFSEDEEDIKTEHNNSIITTFSHNYNAYHTNGVFHVDLSCKRTNIGILY